ncbi:hypothetical protein ABZP36_009360 [Zizania latifolia]
MRHLDQALRLECLPHVRVTTPHYLTTAYSPQTLNYALFRPNRGIYDPNTKLNYTSMFDAQMDAIYTKLN